MRQHRRLVLLQVRPEVLRERAGRKDVQEEGQHPTVPHLHQQGKFYAIDFLSLAQASQRLGDPMSERSPNIDEERVPTFPGNPMIKISAKIQCSLSSNQTEVVRCSVAIKSLWPYKVPYQLLLANIVKEILLVFLSRARANINYYGQWLWHSWQSGCFQYQSSAVRIQSSAIFYNEYNYC